MQTTRMTLRLPADLSVTAAQVAQQQGLSMNAFIVQAVRSWTAYQAGKLQDYEKAVRREKAAPAAAVPKVGANQPCPCGSGLKYKRCHGKPGAA